MKWKSYLTSLSLMALLFSSSVLSKSITFAWNASSAPGYDSSLIFYEFRTKRNSENWITTETDPGVLQLTREIPLVPGDALVVQLRARAGNTFVCNRDAYADCDKSAWVSFDSLPTIDTPIIVLNSPNNVSVFPISQVQTTFFTGVSLGTGTTLQPGSFEQINNLWKLTARGVNIWGSSDSGYFAYSQKTGNFDLIAKIFQVQRPPPSLSAKTGIMIRESLLPTSRNVFLAFTPNNDLRFQSRSANSGSSTTVSRSNLPDPIYIRTTRAGNTFTAMYSYDRLNWTSISSVTVSMPTNVYVGLASTSFTSNIPFDSYFDTLIGF